MRFNHSKNPLLKAIKTPSLMFGMVLNTPLRPFNAQVRIFQNILTPKMHKKAFDSINFCNLLSF